MSHYLAKLGNKVYWCDEPNAKQAVNKGAKVFESSLIKSYIDQKNLLIVRSGGIGDLIALSVLGGDNVTVLTQKKHLFILDWWEQKPNKKHFDEPLFTVKYPKKLQELCNNWGQLSGEDEIELGSKENWYNIFARSANRPFEYGRPQLKDLRNTLPPQRIRTNSTLVVHRASAKHRTFNLRALPEIKGDVYIYNDSNVLFKNGQPIGPTTTPQFLADVYDADNVVSTDTSALHFREGLGKPVTAIFGSFDARSRVKYYEHTSVLQTKTDCKEAPCHRANHSPCPYQDHYYPPCLKEFQLS
jgi:hypothetical protein